MTPTNSDTQTTQSEAPEARCAGATGSEYKNLIVGSKEWGYHPVHGFTYIYDDDGETRICLPNNRLTDQIVTFAIIAYEAGLRDGDKMGSRRVQAEICHALGIFPNVQDQRRPAEDSK